MNNGYKGNLGESRALETVFRIWEVDRGETWGGGIVLLDGERVPEWKLRNPAPPSLC